ncbi:Zn-dependent exopeptidase, partial [Lentithecium fluviatile CBS 122367]
QNGGNRASGKPGHSASVDFVIKRAESFGDRLQVSVQGLEQTIYYINNVKASGKYAENVTINSPQGNLPGTVTGDLTVTPGVMCSDSEWGGVNVNDKIALIVRGSCTAGVKIKGAASHGAKAVILYNNFSGEDYIFPTLGPGINVEDIVPTGIVSFETGTRWVGLLYGNTTLTLTLNVNATWEKKTVNNVFVETSEGDANSIVMLGGHLDSVSAGPGINDDGSGVTALLEIMRGFAEHTGYKAKLRFAFWAAEEAGSVGSTYYTDHLTLEELAKIKIYFNYDMIGSLNPVYYVANNSIPEAWAAQELWSFIGVQGKTPVTYGPFDPQTDWAGFVARNVSVAGVHTGSSTTADPCYHRSCDKFPGNINSEALTVVAKAAARAAAWVALRVDEMPKSDGGVGV